MSARCAAISGCSASASRRLAAAAPSRASGAQRAPMSRFQFCAEATPVRMDLTPQRLERHLLPGNGFSRGRAGAQYLRRSGLRRRVGHPAAGGGLLSRDRSTGPAPDEHRSAGDGGDPHDCRGFRFRAGLPGAVQSRGDRVRACATGPGRLRRSRLPNCWRASPGSRARHRDRQQGERHSQGLAPGGFHQPAGMSHFRVHAGYAGRSKRSPEASRKTTGAWSPRARFSANGWPVREADGRIRAACGPVSN